MRATRGDRLIVRSNVAEEPDREAEILEVHGRNGTPPYLVRWSDTGHESRYTPTADDVIVH